MAFGSFDDHSASQPMAEINTTPLVDVMLVLLVIFIITAPLLQQAVPVDLPRVDATPLEDKPTVLAVVIDGKGRVFVDDREVARAALAAHFTRAAAHGRAPELHLRADRGTHYEVLAEVLALAQGAGIGKIAFVTEPSRE